MMEAAVVLDLAGRPLYWHTPNNRSCVALPDSRDLWSIIWDNRANISGIAHSHPHYGKTGPSYTDITTFKCIEDGLGKRLDWWITSGDSMILVRWNGPGKLEYINVDVTMEPEWLKDLRNISDYKNK